MSKLQRNAILQNAPAISEDILHQAESGNPDAQYMAGLLFAEGRGVPQDEVWSFFWLSLACQQGDEDAMLLRTLVASTMSDTQFSHARKLLGDIRNGCALDYSFTGD